MSSRAKRTRNKKPESVGTKLRGTPVQPQLLPDHRTQCVCGVFNLLPEQQHQQLVSCCVVGLSGDKPDSSLGWQRGPELWWLNAGAEHSGFFLAKVVTGCGSSRKAGEKHRMGWVWAHSRKAQDLGAMGRKKDVQR